MIQVTAASSASSPRRALVTGASTGIGAATVRLLRAHDWEVVATARRGDRLAALSEETGCAWVAADLQQPADVDRLAAQVKAAGPLDAIVNNAGGALGADPVAEGSVEEWTTMYERNVLAALRVTQAFLPELRRRGGDLVFLTSTAAHDTYPGGGGYVAAKHAERVIANTLRLELVGEPVRVIEIAPGNGGHRRVLPEPLPRGPGAGGRGLRGRRRAARGGGCRRVHRVGAGAARTRKHRLADRASPRPGLQHGGGPRLMRERRAHSLATARVCEGLSRGS